MSKIVCMALGDQSTPPQAPLPLAKQKRTVSVFTHHVTFVCTCSCTPFPLYLIYVNYTQMRWSGKGHTPWNPVCLSIEVL
jgi:hypothetical protein